MHWSNMPRDEERRVANILNDSNRLLLLCRSQAGSCCYVVSRFAVLFYFERNATVLCMIQLMCSSDYEQKMYMTIFHCLASYSLSRSYQIEYFRCRFIHLFQCGFFSSYNLLLGCIFVCAVSKLESIWFFIQRQIEMVECLIFSQSELNRQSVNNNG